MVGDVDFLTARELTQSYSRRSLSPVEALQSIVRRLGRIGDRINAFVVVDEARALDEARASERRWMRGEPRGPLDGVPVSVKDTLLVKGLPCRRGSKTTPSAPASESAPIVDRILEAGAIVFGLTTMPEFGVGPVTISPLTGITRNPWDPRRTAGGSSGGAAAAVAAGLGPIAIATDAGGSIRIPAALCGVVGFKGTGSLIPSYPSSPAGGISCPGPIGRSVADIEIVAMLGAHPDLRDPEYLPDGLAGLTSGRTAQMQGLRVGIARSFGGTSPVDAEVLDATSAAADTFRALGAIVESVDIDLSEAATIFRTLICSGVAHAIRNLGDDKRALLGPQVLQAIEIGRRVGIAEYLEAQDARRALGRRLQLFQAKHDLLLTPTVAVPAFAAELQSPDGQEDFMKLRTWTPFTSVFNLTSQPAISVPSGFTRTGMPVGLQIVGSRGRDGLVLAAAAAFEATRPAEMRARQPPLD